MTIVHTTDLLRLQEHAVAALERLPAGADDPGLLVSGLAAQVRAFPLAPALHQPLMPGAVREADLPPAALRHADLQVLEDLRRIVLKGQDSPVTTVWLETLLRTCEIGQRNLRNRCRRLWGHQAHHHLLQIVALFMDRCLAADDMRFLNVTLKLQDQGWLLSPGQAQRDLQAEEPLVQHGLLAFRVLVANHEAWSRLQRAVPS